MLPAIDRKIRMDNIPKNFARKIFVDLVFADHTYAKASSLDPEFNRIHSTSLLFTKPKEDEETGIIDIEGVLECKDAKLNYDEETGKKQMFELEQCYNALHEVDGWQEDDQITRIGWTRDQARLFDQVYKILSTYRVARCSYEGHPKEQILRSLALDKAAKRFRNIAGAVVWDSKLMPWLHVTLVNGINSYLFLCYLELLQNLKSQVHNLVEKMTSNGILKPERSMVLDSPKIIGCLNKALDPTPKLKSGKTKENVDGSQKEQPLENKPLLIMLPRGPCVNLTLSKRSQFWQNQLGNIGRIMQINMIDVEKPEDFAVSSFLESVIGGARMKVSLFKSQFPSRPVILIGWSIGALLSCWIATLENVSGVVCLGYPSHGLDGVKEVESYNCLDIKCPVMFVIGTHSPVFSAEYIENLREKMRVDTKMLLIEGGDEMLKLTSSHKRRMQVTQNMVDRLIMDEVEKFIATILTKGDKVRESNRPDTPSSSSQAMRVSEKKRKLKRPDLEKSMVEKKRVRASPSQQQKMQSKGRTKNVTTQSTGVGKAGSILMPNQLNTAAATQNLTSVTSSMINARTLASSFRDQTARTVGSITQASKLTVRSPHLKYIEKPMKKPKFLKEAQPIPRSLSSPALHGTSKADILAMQRFPTTSSILLSNSGAHLRLHDGKILQVSTADASKLQQSSGQPSTAVLKSQISLGSKTITGIAPFTSKDNSLNVTPVLSSSNSIKSFPGFTNIADSNPIRLAGATSSPNANKGGEFSSTPAVFSSGQGSTQTLSGCSFSTPETTAPTQFSPNDLKYLTDLFNRGQVTIGSTSRNVDIPGASKQLESGQLVPDSPISAKFGIGTLTNLTNPDGSPPGSGTRQSPGSSMKQSPPNEPLVGIEKQERRDQKELSQHTNAESKPIFTQTSTFVRKEINKGLGSTPVTITIPTFNASSQGIAALKVSTVLGTNNVTKSPVLGYSQTFTKTSQSKSASDLSQLVNKSHGKPLLSAASTSRLSIGSSSASPATLTVSSRQIQGTSRNMGNPQTITLHIPNSAMLKDPKNLKTTGSEIKFIGFLNQKGGSPMTSPIHFSVQSQSNPGSPKPQSPSVLFTSKSDPPSPNPGKISRDKDKEIESDPLTSPKLPIVSQPVGPVSVSISKEPTPSLASKTGVAGSKICKPTTIQSALIKSLASVSFSAKQKESIANLLRNQNIVQGQEINNSKDGATLQNATPTCSGIDSPLVTTSPVSVQVTKAFTANSGVRLHSGNVVAPTTVHENLRDGKAKDENDKTVAKEEGARSTISFISDSSVTTIMKKSCESQGEVNGHNTTSGKARDKEINNILHPAENKNNSIHESSQVRHELTRSDPKDSNPNSRYQGNTKCDVASTDLDNARNNEGQIASHGDESTSGIVTSSQLKRQKRLRESSSLDIDTASDDELGPTPIKRLTRRAWSAGDRQDNISNVKKTEE